MANFNLLCFLLFSSFSFSQKEINVIHYYGLEDESSMLFINELSKDSNNLIFLMDQRYFELKNILNNGGLYGKEHAYCDVQLKKIENLDRVSGGSLSVFSSFPTNYLKSIDPEFTEELSSFISKEYNDSLDIKNLSLRERKLILDKIFHLFTLNHLDSIFLEFSILAKDATIHNIANSMEKGKTCYFLYSDIYFVNGFESFVTTYVNTPYNVSILIAKKGSFIDGKGQFSFRNRIKKSRRTEPFTLLKSSQLPRVIKLSKTVKIRTGKLSDFKLIYVPKLSNCVW